MLRCPKCSSNNIMTERRMDGDSICQACGFKWATPRPDFARPGDAAWPTFTVDMVKGGEELAARLPKFKSHKVVSASIITHITNAADATGDCVLLLQEPQVAFRTSSEWFKKHNPEVGGYLVVYLDGYTSFSPRKAFVDGYSPLAHPKPSEPPPVRVLAPAVDSASYDPMNLSYFKPGPEGLQHISVLRQHFIDLSKSVGTHCPKSRELSLALTHLEQACMYAVKAVVVHDPASEKQKP